MRQLIENYPFGSNRGSITPQPPDYVDRLILSAGAAKRHALPAGAKFVSFSATGDFYAKFGNNSITATLSGTDVVDGSAPELNPMARRFPDGVTHVSLISEVDLKITLSFWA